MNVQGSWYQPTDRVESVVHACTFIPDSELTVPTAPRLMCAEGRGSGPDFRPDAVPRHAPGA